MTNTPIEMRIAASRACLPMFLLLLAMSTPVAAQSKATPKAAPSSASTLQSAIQSGRLNDLRWPNFSDYRAHVDRFYRQRSYKLAWFDSGKPTPRAQQMI